MVGTHSGISIGEDGPSQMSVEEIALACSLAGFVVIAPADEVSTKALVRAAAAHDGPGVHPHRTAEGAGDLRRGPEVRDRQSDRSGGGHATSPLIANGLLVAEAIRAADALEAEGISARVIDMHTVKPLDREAIARAAAETGAIVVAEEHLVDGGLGVRVAQVVAETHPAPWSSSGFTTATRSPGSPTSCWTSTAWCARDIAAAARKVLARKTLAGPRGATP